MYKQCCANLCFYFKSHIPNTWKRVRSQGGAGMLSVLEPAQLLLCLMPEINLPDTGLPPCPNKRQMIIPNGLHTSSSQTRSHGFSSYAPSRLQDILWSPSESRKGSDPLQAKLSFKRCHLCALSLIISVIKEEKEGRADLLNLLHQWPLPSRERCSGSEIAAGKTYTLLFTQLLQLWASRTSPDKRAQHYL